MRKQRIPKRPTFLRDSKSFGRAFHNLNTSATRAGKAPSKIYSKAGKAPSKIYSKIEVAGKKIQHGYHAIQDLKRRVETHGIEKTVTGNQSIYTPAPSERIKKYFKTKTKRGLYE
jgi:NAD+--asparagine ADP-ribosyltransferase